MYAFKRANIDELPSEYKEYHNGILILHLGNRDMVQGIDFRIADKGPRSTIKECERCGEMRLMEARGMCHNCYERIKYYDKHPETIERVAARRANKRAAREKAARRAFVETYPNNLLLAVYELPKEVTEFTEKQISDMEVAFDCLTQRQQDFVLGYYRDDNTFRNLGLKYKLSFQRCNQIVNRAVRKMRQTIRSTDDDMAKLAWSEMPLRTQRALRKNGIATVSQLTALSCVDVCRLKGVGILGEEAIVKALAKYGYSLAKMPEQDIAAEMQSIVHQSTTGRNLAKNIADRPKCDLAHLDVPDRTFYALYRRRITTIEQLCNMTLKELKRLPGIGNERLADIMRALEQSGLSVRGDESDRIALAV